MLSDISKWLHTFYEDTQRKHIKVPALIKRIHTIQLQIQKLTSSDENR